MTARAKEFAGARVLVTGAGGFIGSHLVERLVDEGAHVRALVHYNALGSRGWLDRSPVIDRIEVVPGDITDAGSVRDAMRGTTHVFHLAALIAIPYSYKAPSSYIRTNIEGTLHVLQAVRELDVQRLVHTSTSEVYGTARYTPIDEAHPLQGQSPYSASKIGADKLVESFFCSFGVPVVTLRPFNTFGPRQSTRAIIPTIVSQLMVGDEVRLGHVHPTRDLNYVDDTVDAFVRAASTPSIEGETIHVGSGREIAIGDLARAIAQEMGKTARIVVDDARVRPAQSEVDRLLADSSRARERLGWAPTVPLEEGLRRTIAWLQAHGFPRDVGQYTL
jgi:NAD dependent epimerase/dehydratase